MRVGVVAGLSLIVGILGCKKPVPSAPPDAGSPIVVADTASAPAKSAAPPDAAAPVAQAKLPPLTTDSFALVAVGKSWKSKVVWLNVHGDRVWLSAVNLDAYADGDGPLAPGPDLLKDLPYASQLHAVHVAGVHPHLVAVRALKAHGRIESADAATFVRKDGAWVAVKGKDEPTDFPDFMVPWGDAVLIGFGQYDPSGRYAPFNRELPGTKLRLVNRDGTIAEANIGLDREFVAWKADSDGVTLSLIGRKRDTAGLHVARGTAKDGFKIVSIVPNAAGPETLWSHVREQGSFALALPPGPGMDLGVWKPRNAVFVVSGETAASRVVPEAKNRSCYVKDGVMIDDAVIAIRLCLDGKRDSGDLVRVTSTGAEDFALPSLTKADGGHRIAKSGEPPLRCEAKSLALHGAGDLWVEALCYSPGAIEGAGIPAIFRRGKPQDPIVLP
jgi:hypothetical protein